MPKNHPTIGDEIAAHALGSALLRNEKSVQATQRNLLLINIEIHRCEERARLLREAWARIKKRKR